MKSKKTQQTQKKIKEAYARGRDTVKGRLDYFVNRGGLLEFSFRSLKGPIEEYKIRDGEVCELPLAVAEHLQNMGKVTVHRNQYDEATRKSYSVGQTFEEFSFTPTDFNAQLQQKMIQPDLVTVKEIK